MSVEHKNLFFTAAESWVCDKYTIDIRFIAYLQEGNWQLWNAELRLNPLPLDETSSFKVEFEQFKAGQIVRNGVRRKEIFEILEAAARGQIIVDGQRLSLVTEYEFDFYSEMVHRNNWFSNLHLRITSNPHLALGSVAITNLDNRLRRNIIPFDGVTDLVGWLGLPDPNSSVLPSINIWANPPIDLRYPESRLQNGMLNLVLHAHPKLDLAQITVALRAVPGNVHMSRMQVATSINWSRTRAGRRIGNVAVELPNVDSALVVLMFGEALVRRQWILDPSKARNTRFLAFQHFDNDLKMLRKAIVDPSASDLFEKGIEALLFLIGFTPTQFTEKDAPDILVATPSGRLVLVECTIKFNDFTTKMNKLIHRRASLSRVLENSGHYANIECALICSISRDQLVNVGADLRENRVILASREDISQALEQVRFPRDPDEILEEAIARLIAPVDSQAFQLGLN